MLVFSLGESYCVANQVTLDFLNPAAHSNNSLDGSLRVESAL
jgi:hypothetical protein